MLDVTNLSSLSSRRDDLSRNFFLSILSLHPVYTISFPHPDLMQLHLGEEHTKFTQNRPPVQSDIVPLCNMAFLTTRKGLPTVNVHPSVSFYICWRFQLLTVISPIIIPILL